MNQVVTLPNQQWTPEQMRLITTVVAKGATPDELKLFLYRAQVLGLDPLKPGQIFFVKYGNNPGTVVVGIDGFRAKAVRTGKLSGIKRGVIKDEKGKLLGAWAEVHRAGWSIPVREEVPFDEYDTGYNNWKDMPETMIKKVAEAAALRMAFPDDLGGVYIEEEVQKSQTTAALGIKPEQPPLDGTDGDTTPSPTKIPYGQWSGRTCEEVARVQGLPRMRDYVEWLDQQIVAGTVRGNPENAKLTLNIIGDFIANQEIAPLVEDKEPLKGNAR